MVFVDYSTDYPSVHRDGLSSNLLKSHIRGNMWHHLRVMFDKIKLRVLHPGISAHHTVDILRGIPKGSRLSPTLFGIFVADLVHELRGKFPHAVYKVNTRGNLGVYSDTCIMGILLLHQCTSNQHMYIPITIIFCTLIIYFIAYAI